jgi:hypothetical protein
MAGYCDPAEDAPSGFNPGGSVLRSYVDDLKDGLIKLINSQDDFAGLFGGIVVSAS